MIGGGVASKGMCQKSNRNHTSTGAMVHCIMKLIVCAQAFGGWLMVHCWCTLPYLSVYGAVIAVRIWTRCLTMEQLTVAISDVQTLG